METFVFLSVSVSIHYVLFGINLHDLQYIESKYIIFRNRDIDYFMTVWIECLK